MNKREVASSYKTEGREIKSIRIGERDRRARSKFLRGRGDPGRCRRSIRFLPYALFLPRTFSPSNKGEAVINTCVYSSTTFPPSSPPVSARHLCLEAPRPLNLSPCVCVRMTLPVIIFRAAVLYRRIRLIRLRISFVRCVLVPEKFSPSFLLERTRNKSNLCVTRVMKSLIDCVLRRLQSPLVDELTLCGVVARHFLFPRFPLSKCKLYVNQFLKFHNVRRICMYGLRLLILIRSVNLRV